MHHRRARAEWLSEEHLTLHDATQYVKGVQDVLAKTFSLKPENVRVISPFVGGAFGCKGAVWPHVILSAMALGELRAIRHRTETLNSPVGE